MIEDIIEKLTIKESTEEVTITDDMSLGFDEVWMEFFKCPKCGVRVPDDSKYCWECGSKIQWSISKERD